MNQTYGQNDDDDDDSNRASARKSVNSVECPFEGQQIS